MAGTTAIPQPHAEIRDDLSSATARSPWIVSAGSDLLFFVNAWWLAAFLPGFLSAERTPHIEFWQVYFLTTPHRWITLFVVAADPDRRAGRSWLFATIALVTLAVVAAVRLGTGGFLCLLLLDYVWNAWHFAAQHAGILRMYSRKSGTEWPWLETHRPGLETWGLRSIVFYTSLRLAGWSTGWLEAWPAARTCLAVLDVVMAIPVLGLLAVELAHRPGTRPGKVAYLSSVEALYLALLSSVALGWSTLVLSLTAAAAAFHAIEYLAVVTHYAQRRRTQGSRGLFRAVAQSWGLILAGYIILLGLVANFADALSPEFWIGINLWAAGLHYAYDGLIWKLRAPETAAVLDVAMPATCEASQHAGRARSRPAAPRPVGPVAAR